MVEFLVTLLGCLIALALGCVILYFVVKAAVAQGVKEAVSELEVRVNLRGTVKEGVLEAQREIEKDKAGGNHG